MKFKIPDQARTHSISRLGDATATPTVAETSSRTFSGVIYDSQGLICRAAQRTRNGVNEWTPSDSGAIAVDVSTKYIPGRSLYLGHYTGHYGHFLIETLARLWPLLGTTLHEAGYDRVVFHPFLHKTPAVNKFSPARASFASFGIKAQQVVLVNEPLRFEFLDVPVALLKINDCVDPGMFDVYQHIAKHCLSVRSSRIGIWPRLLGWPVSGPLRLYLSRRRAKGFHPMLNEREVERVFVDAGFKVLHPERWSFEQQVALFQRADIIAGVEGSALHNSVFMGKRKKVINIGTSREPSGDILNQRLVDSLSGVSSLHIPFQGTLMRGHKALYDVSFLKSAVASLIK